MTQVKFLIENEHNSDFLPGVFAYFPEIIGDNKGNNTSYAHIGQHSACSPRYASMCKEAITNEYLPLLRELIGQGYKDLQIINKQVITAHREPTAYEIKFGEGATHYRDFTMSEIGITKTGNIKKWFKADDGLRYYTT